MRTFALLAGAVAFAILALHYGSILCGIGALILFQEAV